MKVLITGAAGYIGSVLTQRLLSIGYKVYGLDNLMHSRTGLMANLGHPNFHFEEFDVREGYHSYMGLADVVIPLAAIVGAPICEVNPRLAREVNQEAIKTLITNLSKNQLVLYPDTNSGYGSTSGIKECTEQSEMHPISTYGKTKLEGEKCVLTHPKSVVFRLATVFGCSPRMRFDLLLNNFVEKLNDERQMTIYEPSFMRNFVHIRDVVRAIEWAIDCNKTSTLLGVYNLGNPSCNVSKYDLAQEIMFSKDMGDCTLKLGKGKDPDQRNYIVSNKKILDTGFTFRYNLQDGIKEVLQFCKVVGKAERAPMRNY